MLVSERMPDRIAPRGSEGINLVGGTSTCLPYAFLKAEDSRGAKTVNEADLGANDDEGPCYRLYHLC